MRLLKGLGVGLAVLLFVVVAFLARIHGKLAGPTPPACRLPELERRTFQAPIQISGPGSPGARDYDIEPHGALLADGSLALVYNPRAKIWAGESGLSTGKISPDGKLELRAYPTDTKEAFDAWMARGADGVLRLVYLAHDGGSPEVNMRVATATSQDGVRWSSPPRASHAPADCPEAQPGCLDKPMIAATSSAVLLFYYSNAGEPGLRAARAPYRQRPAQSRRIGDGAYAQVAVSARGTVHVVYVGQRVESEEADPFGDVQNDVLWVSSTDDGQTFSAPREVSLPDEPIPFFFSNPQVVADDARGLLYVAYPSGTPDGRWNIRLATSHDGGATFRHVTVNDDELCATHMTPHAALDPLTGTVHLTWLENRTGQGGLAYAACAPGGERCGKNEAVSDAFAAFGFARHLPMWLSEYGLLLVDAERRVLHALWTQPVLEDGTEISRIFHARATLTAPAPP